MQSGLASAKGKEEVMRTKLYSTIAIAGLVMAHYGKNRTLTTRDSLRPISDPLL
jgi:hypothetical protein